eukprot:3393014-Amphidinium_carterae.1
MKRDCLRKKIVPDAVIQSTSAQELQLYGKGTAIKPFIASTFVSANTQLPTGVQDEQKKT